MKHHSPFYLFALVLLVLSIGLSGCGAKGGVKSQAVEYALTTGLQDGKMVFIGSGGEIDGMVNPTLKANTGDTVKITLTSGEGAEHNIIFPDFNAESEHVSGRGKSITLSFTIDKGVSL